jgi:RHS repeat-associated protein
MGIASAKETARDANEHGDKEMNSGNTWVRNHGVRGVKETDVVEAALAGMEACDPTDIVRATAVSDGFGNITTESGAIGSCRWTGREYDAETGLQYNRARYYLAEVARWLSEDPLGFEAGDVNLYRYVGNNSTNTSDPSGFEGLSGEVSAPGIPLSLPYRVIKFSYTPDFLPFDPSFENVLEFLKSYNPADRHDEIINCPPFTAPAKPVKVEAYYAIPLTITKADLIERELINALGNKLEDLQRQSRNRPIPGTLTIGDVGSLVSAVASPLSKGPLAQDAVDTVKYVWNQHRGEIIVGGVLAAVGIGAVGNALPLGEDILPEPVPLPIASVISSPFVWDDLPSFLMSVDSQDRYIYHKDK